MKCSLGVVALSVTVAACRSGRSAEAPPPQALTGVEVEHAIIAIRKPIKHECWDAALVAGGPRDVRIVTQFTIRSDGTVSSVTATDSPEQYPNMSRCIVDKLRTLSFRPSREDLVITVPFLFGAR
jgi:hypothetical protein